MIWSDLLDAAWQATVATIWFIAGGLASMAVYILKGKMW